MNNPMDDLDKIIADANEILGEEPKKKAPSVTPEQDYSRWLFEQGEEVPAQTRREEPEKPAPEAPKKKKKKKRGLWWKIPLCLILAIAVLLAAMVFLTAKQPMAKEGTLGERKPGCSTILLAGTDADGTRTDTMLLLHLSEKEGKISLISLPRDTRVSGGYSVPKLNSVFGAGGGGRDGMEALMQKVTGIIGYRPDGYMLVDLEGFVKLIDAVGGVTYNVPQDMHYDDPYQDLHIDLKAGEQHLNGEQSMWLVRFRSGYARADLQRVEVQRDFLKSALKQIVNVKNILKAPRLISTALSHTTTDMTFGNLVWLAKTAAFADKENVTMETLPGEPQMISGGSYYVLNFPAVAELINSCCNPYVTPVAAENLAS